MAARIRRRASRRKRARCSSPPAVRAAVGQGGQELADQVAVRGVQLGGLEAGRQGPARGRGEIREKAPDFLLGERAGDLRPVADRRGSQQGEASGLLAGGLPPGMVELDGRDRPGAVDGGGQGAQPRHLPVVEEAHLPPVQPPLRGDRAGLDHHPASPRGFGIVGHNFRRHPAVLPGLPADHGGDDDPVGGTKAADGQGLGKPGEARRQGGLCG